MTFEQVYGEFILIKPVEDNQTTDGGIVIPSQGKEKPQVATVVKVGDDVKSGVKEGDTILYAKYSIDEVEHNGEKHNIIREEDVYAKVNL